MPEVYNLRTSEFGRKDKPLHQHMCCSKGKIGDLGKGKGFFGEGLGLVWLLFTEQFLVNGFGCIGKLAYT